LLDLHQRSIVGTVLPSRGSVPLLLAGFLLLAPHGISAQAARSICSNTALRTGLLIRVRDTTAASVVGPFVSCRDTMLTLAYYPGQIDSGYAVRTMLIRRLWVRGTQGRSGLIFGAAAGALAGGGIAATRSKICFKGWPPVYATCHDNIAVNAAIFGAAGGLVGWVLGRGFPHWTKIFP
jgi:hypothetical protein